MHDPYDGKMTTSQAAAYLGVSYNRIVYAVYKRWLVPERSPHGDLFLQTDLDIYAERRGLKIRGRAANA